MRGHVACALLGPLVAAFAAAAVASASAGGTASASRIVDRTFRCTPVLGYPAREVDVVASPRGGALARGTVTATSIGYLGVGSGVDDFAYDLVSVVARPQERFRQSTMPAGVYATARRCTDVRARVALSSGGLASPPVRFSASEECAVRGRVLVRVRALLQRPVQWQQTGPLERGVRVNVVEATIVVRTERGRTPVALLRLERGGKTALWSSPACS